MLAVHESMILGFNAAAVLCYAALDIPDADVGATPLSFIFLLGVGQAGTLAFEASKVSGTLRSSIYLGFDMLAQGLQGHRQMGLMQQHR